MKFLATFAHVCALLCVCNTLWGQHASDISVQLQDDQLVTGSSFDSEFEGVRVFSSQSLTTFGGILVSDDPGFVGDSTPGGGVDPLPADQTLQFSVLPMSIGDVSANLMFWDGQSGDTQDDVSFVPAESSLEISLFNFKANVDGSDSAVPGFPIATTSEQGEIHRHLDYEISDAEEGIYLLALQMEMEGFEPSEPTFIVHGLRNPHPFETPPSPFFEFAEFWSPRQDAAVGWVAENLLNPPIDLLLADFDEDGDVDSADRTTITANWTGALMPGEGMADRSQGDADFDGDVDSADQNILVSSWTGAQMATNTSIVPEPRDSIALALIFVFLLTFHRLRTFQSKSTSPMRG